MRIRLDNRYAWVEKGALLAISNRISQSVHHSTSELPNRRERCFFRLNCDGFIEGKIGFLPR